MTAAAAGAAAGGMSKGLIVGIVGAGAVGGLAVAASGGGGEAPSPTRAPATTTPSTTLPPASTPPPPAITPGADVTGHWTGSLAITTNAACDLEGDLTADLAQSGTTVTGTIVYRTRRHADRPDCRMEVRPMATSGSIAGTTITLQLVVPDEGPMVLVGTITPNTMSGTWTCAANCTQGGTWTLTRS
jgi:hypothetical protein